MSRLRTSPITSQAIDYLLDAAHVGQGSRLLDVGTVVHEIEMKPGDSIHVVPKTIHRMTALEDCDVLEASTPELDDVVRLEDRYGREGT